MGLVLGTDGKKLKSRTGDAVLARDAMSAIEDNLRDIPPDRKERLAWNIIAWNMLQSARGTNIKFEPERWVRPESPGMYITYTYARTVSALNGVKQNTDNLELTENDVKLLGTASTGIYHYRKAVENLDPAPLASHAHELAKMLNLAYERESIRGGRPGMAFSVLVGMLSLRNAMEQLGMFTEAEV